MMKRDMISRIIGLQLTLLMTWSAVGVSISPANAATTPTVEITTIPVSDYPDGIAVNPTNNHVYVAHLWGSMVSVIDGYSNSVIKVIPVQSCPKELGVNPTTNKIYVTHYELPGSPVEVIDGNTNVVVDTIGASRKTSGIAVNPVTNLVYIDNVSGNCIEVIDGSTNSVLDTIQVGVNADIAVNPVTNKIYAGSHGGKVWVIDGITNNVVDTIEVGFTDAHFLDVNPNTNKIYVSHGVGSRILVIDGATSEIVDTVQVNGSAGDLAVNADTNRVYVSTTDGPTGTDIVTVIDGLTNAVVNTIQVATHTPWTSGISRIAVDPTRNLVYATNSLDDTVVVISEGSTGSVEWELQGTITNSDPPGSLDWNCFWDLETGVWVRTDQNVCITNAVVTDSHTMTVTIDNAYPYYGNHLAFEVHGLGTIPLRIWKANFLVDDVVIETIYAGDEYIYLDLDGDGLADLEIWWGDGFGHQLHECNKYNISFKLLVLQPAPQDEELSFTIELVGIQWNEYTPGSMGVASAGWTDTITIQGTVNMGAGQVGGNTWYVDDDGTHPGSGTEADPFTSIQDAVNAASSGDTIIVYPGTYIENVDVSKDRLTIQSENGADSTIVQAADPDDHVFEVMADYMNIQGFTVKGATGSDKAGIYLDNVDHCQISNNIVLNNKHGIHLNDSSYNDIDDNTVKLCSGSGIFLDYSPISGPYLPAVGHSDPGDQWEDEPLAYDENRNTYARVYLSGGMDSSPLELLAPSGKPTEGIRFWGSGGPLEVDIYYDGYWHCLRDWPWGISSAPANEWVELTYPSKIVGKARIKFHGRVLSGWSYLSEFQFKTVLDISCSNNDIIGNTVSDNGAGIRFSRSSNNRIYLNNFINDIDNGYSSDSSNLCNSPEQITYTYNGNTYTNYLGNYWSDYGVYSPAVGHSDPGDQWEDEPLAYDENRNTYARVYLSGGMDSSPLELLAPSGKPTEGIRFWGSGGPLEVDIYYDGYWHCLRDWPWGISSAPANEWVELTYPSKIVGKARIKFHGRVLSGWSYLNEFQFKTTSSDDAGSDADGDGIGDTPYSIDGDNDNYPLMEPLENYEIGAVLAVTVAALPPRAGAIAAYNINFTTGIDLGLGEVIVVEFPLEVTIPTIISKSMIALKGGDGNHLVFVPGDADPVISGQQLIVTVPSSGPLVAGACTLMIAQVAGIINPPIAKTLASQAYPVKVYTGVETTPATGYLGIIPGYRIAPISGDGSTPVTVTGEGWAPNQSITVGGSLSGTGTSLSDGTFSLTATPVSSGQVTCADGFGQTETHAVGGVPWDFPVTVPVFTLEALEEWSFAIITDLHIGRGYPDYGGESWNDAGTAGQDYYLTERLEREVQTVIDLEDTHDIRFVVVLGDIADSAEYSEFDKAKSILDRLDVEGIPYVPLIGNHDVWPYTKLTDAEYPMSDFYFRNIFIKERLGTLNNFFQDWESPIIAQEVTWIDPMIMGERTWTALLQNYAFNYESVNFICLDFVAREPAPLGGDGVGSDAVLWDGTKQWLVDHLRAGEPTVLFSHHPFDDNPMNAFSPGLWVCPGGGTCIYLPGELDMIGETIVNSGSNVQATFAGHVHGFYDESLPFVPELNLNPLFMNANKEHTPSSSLWFPPDIPVVTTEALMVGSNEPAPKGIVRIVNVTGGEIQDYNMLDGEVAARAVNPYFKAEVQELSLANLFGPYWRELIAGKVRVDFEGYAFTKRVSEDYPIAYHWDFGDGAGETYLIDDWTEKCNVEPYFYAAQPGRTYDVTLTVEGFTPEGEAIQESLTRIIGLPQRLVIQAACPVDIAVTDPDGLTIDKQSNEISGAIYGERDVNEDGEPDDVIVIPHRKIGDYIITVTPEPDASPTDTFSLVITVGNETATLVEDTPLGDIPSEPYAIRSTEEATLLIFPVADANGPYASTEGSPITFDATGSYDPDGITTLYEWDFDDDGLYDLASLSPLADHVYGDDFTGDVTLRVTDNDGLTSFDIAPATVLNVAPIVGNITAPQDPVPVNTPVYATGNFTDPGILDTHTAEWDWGDGNTTAGIVTETNGSGNVSGSYAYTGAGIYTVKLTVTDDDGGVGLAEYQYVVVYDPDGGFVTGGGWIDSPEGAYIGNTTLTGKATFGFVSKYKKGATVPSGQTEFQFKVADLNFHSDSYDWLVIAGHKAMYKGTGTINGEGNYGFMLSAIDAELTPSTDVDMFRIKIWDKDDDDAIFYDNQMDAPEDADPSTAIGGGSIVVHSNK